MKVLIIGLDGAEASIIESFPELDNLRLDYMGRHTTPKGKFNTPVLWASFLSGLHPKEHKIVGYWRWESKRLRSLKRISKRLGLGRIRGKRKVIEKIGVKSDQWSFEDLPRCIFDEIFKFHAISIPPFTELQIPGLVRAIAANPEGKKLFLEKLEDRHKSDIEQTFQVINDDWDLFMVHFWILDGFQHVIHRPSEQNTILEKYREVNTLVGKIIDQAAAEKILIVSDHGLLRGLHTDYGYWSSTDYLGEGLSILDFYGIITDWTGKEDKDRIEEEELIKKRLEKLGYI